MFDRRLFGELKTMRAFWLKVTTTAIVVVTLTILQGQKLSWLINAIIIEKKDVKSLGGVFLFLALIMLAKAGVSFALERYNRFCGIKIKENIRKRLTARFIELGPIQLKSEKAGSLASITHEGVDNLEPYYSEFIPQLVLVMASTPLVLMVVLVTDWISGLIMLFTVPFIPVFMILIGKTASFVNKKQWKTLQQMNGHFLDVLRGLSTLRLFNRLKRQAEIVKEVNEAFRDNTLKVLRISFLSALVLELVATLSTAIVAVSLGLRLLYGHMNFYDAFFILLLTPEYYQPIRQLGAKFHAAMGARAAAESVYSFDLQEDSDPLKAASTKTLTTPIHLSIDGLFFAYENGPQVLTDIQIEIPQGKRIAFVGPSGGGKSTLIALLLGFIKANKGDITLNGLSIDTFSKESWQAQFAYVPQTPRLFRGSLWDNLVMAKPETSKAAVEKVMNQIGLGPWVEGLPQGYETRLGEGGMNLSGGQTQLVALARALLKGAPILIMDEPTSALDPQTELKINDLLEAGLKNQTVITIAHRIPTIIRADCIYYMDRGEIIEKGSHKELLKNQKQYHKIITTWGGIE